MAEIDDTKPDASVPDRLRADWLTWLETSRLYRLLRITEPIGIVLAVLAIALDLSARQESRVVDAWQLLTTRAPGNSGKVQALKYLNSNSIWKKRSSLRGIDLSAADGREGVYLEGVDLRGADLTNANFSSASLSHANFTEAGLDGAIFGNLYAVAAKFSGARLVLADFGNSEFHSSSFDKIDHGLFNTAGAKFIHSDFTDSHVSFTGGANLDGSNVSGACLYASDSVGGPAAVAGQGGTVWAYATTPAKNLPAFPAVFNYVECAVEPPVAASGAITGLRMDYASCVAKPPPVAQGHQCLTPQLPPRGPDG